MDSQDVNGSRYLFTNQRGRKTTKVFIAGATGVLGRRLIRSFQERGHSVTGLARNPKGEEVIQSLGGESRHADLFDAESLTRAAEGAEVVIHAATSIPTKLRTSLKDWEMNDRIRREGTQALTTCAANIGAKVYLQQSVVWVAKPSDGADFDENSPTAPDLISRSSLDGEKLVLEAGERSDFTVVALRCGWFYGADAAHTRSLGQDLLKRRMPVIGKGDAVWSCLHLDDAASAFVAAADATHSGIWHVVDNQPAPVGEFLSYFAERLGAPPPRRVWTWLARLVAGSYAVNFCTISTQTSNAKFRSDFGWEPRFPSFKEGLDQIISTWQSEGFFQEMRQ